VLQNVKKLFREFSTGTGYRGRQLTG
jgi:hypothetical protein